MFVLLDYESTGLDYYKKDFGVVSASLAWSNGRVEFIVGQEAVGARLAQLGDTPVYTYNLSFELGVTRCVYPRLSLNFTVDVQRLVQLWDNGGDGPFRGFGLKKAVHRVLGDTTNYEAEAHEWIAANVPGAKRGKAGEHISKLPLDILERYNTADTVKSLELFNKISQHFKSIDYDWTTDHELYLSAVHLIVDAKIQGVLIDREQLAKDIESLEAEVADIDHRFLDYFESEVAAVRQALMAKAQTKYKKKILTDLPSFNINSKAQLKRLFVDLLQMDCGFKTKKGAPSFKASHLGLYGPGGKILEKRGKRLMVLNQAKALHFLSGYDGRWHPSLRAVGTSSGRFAGGN